MTKFGLEGLTKYLAATIAPLVRVNSLCPSGILNSDMDEKFQNKLRNLNPMNGIMELSDLDGAVKFLATDESRFVNGHSLIIDGGRSIFMSSVLENKTVLITGVTGGIGYEICKKYYQKNSKLVLIGRNNDSLAEIAKEFNAEYFCCDFTFFCIFGIFLIYIVVSCCKYSGATIWYSIQAFENP